MSPRNTRFTNKTDKQLIELVKQNPTLYDISMSRQLDSDAREVIWHKIGDTLRIPPQTCKSRWVNIRDMMRKRLRERLSTGSKRPYIYRYEPELQFMIPHFKDLQTSMSEDLYHQEDEGTAEYLENTDFDKPTYRKTYSNVSVDIKPVMNRQSLESTLNEGLQEMTEENTDYDKPSYLKTYSNVSVDIKPVMNRQCLESTPNEGLQEMNRGQLNPADPLDVFLMTIGATLRRFNPYYLNKAKSKLFQIVQEFELQQIVDKGDTEVGSSDGDR